MGLFTQPESSMRLAPVTLALLGSLITLAGCASIRPQGFTGPNGRPAYLLQCSGLAQTFRSCEKKAADLCPAGYANVDRPTGVPGLPQFDGGTLVTPDKTMAVECKQA
jgi:hypothetical protein